MARIVVLEGTWHHPVLRLTFNPWDSHPNGGTMLAAVKALPTRRFDPETRQWLVEGIGPNPQGWLDEAGFELDTSEWEGGEDVDLTELVTPVAKTSVRDRGTILVRPRLLGYDLVAQKLGEGATWDKARRRFEIQATDLVTPKGKVRGGVILDPAEAQAAAARHGGQLIADDVADEVARVAEATDATTSASLRQIPDWFGMALYGYQHSGAIAAASGRRLVADPPGLGKTRTALAAASIDDPDRLLVITPPVALTQWQREVTASQVSAPGRYEHDGEPVGDTSVITPGEHVVMIVPGRKVPPFPETGTVVISDSLLSSRPHLAADLAAWGPQVLIVDEAHRAKTWSSARAKATRAMAEATSGPRYALSGTPMFAQPVELASLLAVTGQLAPVFGGYTSYLKKFSFKNHFKAWVARKGMLPELHRILAGQVWVRRRKAEVLKDLPAKARRALTVDVDLSGFRKTHKKVIEIIDEWIDDQTGPTGSLPEPEEVEAFCQDSLGLISRLRQAAGLAKVEAATQIISDWLEQNPADEDGTFDRPLIVWSHHKVVTAAMARAAQEAVGAVEVIDGSTSQDERTQIVDAFQAGQVPVLVASITAAGVGITLTRSSDVLFVETDWTPAQVAQAEDRAHRIGSKRPVMVTTLVAPGTLDETVQRVQAKKAKTLEVVLGDSDQTVSVAAEGARPAAQILTDMVNARLARRRKIHTRKAAA